MNRSYLLALGLISLVAGCGDNTAPSDSSTPDLETGSSQRNQRIHVILTAPAHDQFRLDLARFGRITGEIPQLNAVLMGTRLEQVAAIRALPFVKSAGPDVEVQGGPATVTPTDEDLGNFGANVWNLDAINVTDFGTSSRQVPFDGTGVYVAVLDTGLLPSWPFYFDGKSVATQYATTFGGGGAAEQGATPSPPNKWEDDVHGHGTHVASTIIGYRITSAATGGIFPVNGVAPAATLIPVKVLNQNGGGWSSAIAAGIVYIADLFSGDGPLADSRVVINLSLGSPAFSPLEKEAIDYAIARNVVIVAGAGNTGPDGPMGYPAAYAPVISVGTAGWTGEWNDPAPNCEPVDNGFDQLTPGRFWRQCDVTPALTEPAYTEDEFYITANSPEPNSTAPPGPQDLDVAAPGSLIIGPFQLNQAHLDFFFLGGSSQATPHVTGIAALMLQKNPILTPAQIETCLEQAAHDLDDEGQQVLAGPGGPLVDPSDWTIDGRQGHGFITADAALASSCFA